MNALILYVLSTWMCREISGAKWQEGDFLAFRDLSVQWVGGQQQQHQLRQQGIQGNNPSVESQVFSETLRGWASLWAG